MKYLIYKDKKNRLNLKKKELKNTILRSFRVENFVFYNNWYTKNDKKLIPNFVNFYKNREFFSFSSIKEGHFTKIRNRCILSGRSRSIYRRYHVSRIVFRELATRGHLSGIRKVSW